MHARIVYLLLNYHDQNKFFHMKFINFSTWNLKPIIAILGFPAHLIKTVSSLPSQAHHHRQLELNIMQMLAALNFKSPGDAPPAAGRLNSNVLEFSKKRLHK